MESESDDVQREESMNVDRNAEPIIVEPDDNANDGPDQMPTVTVPQTRRSNETNGDDPVLDADTLSSENVSGNDDNINAVSSVSVDNTASEDINYDENSQLTPTIRKRKRSNSDSNNLIVDASQCPICLEEWEVVGDHRIVSLKCGHLFGYRCLKKWFEMPPAQQKTCPTCKTRAAKRDIRFIYAKHVYAVDNTELEHYRNLYETEVEKCRKLNLTIDRLHLDLSVEKKFNKHLKDTHDRLLEQWTNRFSKNRIDYNFKLEITAPFSSDVSSRVFTYSSHLKSIYLTQHTNNPLFGSYALRAMPIDTFALNPTLFRVSSKPIRDLNINADNDLLVCSCMENGAQIVDLKTFASPKTVKISNAAVWSSSFDQQRTNFLYLGLNNGTIYTYDIRNLDRHVSYYNIDKDFTPVVNICSVQSSLNIPFGGFVFCTLRTVWFYEFTAHGKVVEYKLPIDGPFISLTIYPSSNTLYISARPTLKQPNVRYIVGNIVKINEKIDFVQKSLTLGSKLFTTMTRGTIFTYHDKFCISNYDECKKLLNIWDIEHGETLQIIRMEDTILDMISFENNSDTLLCGLANKKVFIYKNRTSE